MLNTKNYIEDESATSKDVIFHNDKTGYKIHKYYYRNHEIQQHL